MLDFGVDVIWFSKESYMPNENLPPHKHMYYHYIYILNGTGKITIDRNEYVVQENDFYLTHKGLTHSLESKGKEGMRVIEIKFEVNNEQLALNLNELDLKLKPLGLETRYKLENLVHEGMKKELYYKDIISVQFVEILLFLLRYSKGIQNSNINRIYDKGKMNFNEKAVDCICLNDVIMYMKSNLNSELNLDTLARVAKMSKYHFCRFFKENLGVTPIQYINMLRISRAKELLMYSDLNITQIAYNVGFNDARYFSRMFKRKVGLTPSEYSKKNKPNLYFFLKNRKDILYS